MRVTQSMLSNNTLRNLSNTYSKLSKLNEQINTQKKFSKPSDDPVAAMNAMGYRTDLNKVEQYQENISTVENWVDSTGDALNSVNNVLQKIRELTVQASNGTLEEKQRSYIAEEIKQLQNEIISISDTQVGGKYIFGGTKTDMKPSDNYDNAKGEINIQVFNGITLPLNMEGSTIFDGMVGYTQKLTNPDGSVTENEKEGVIQKLIDTLTSGGSEEEIGAYLTQIDQQMDKVLGKLSVVGARQNRVELMSDRLSNQEVFSTRILSDNEDVDLERVAIDLTAQESVLRAALSTGASIIQPTLMDFLR
ncbi:MAG: flagellar hook-associated protein FlgL [Bacillus sp. (in: firmicutes)]